MKIVHYSKIAHLAPPRRVFFDWDRTLIDGSPAVFESLNKVFATFDMPEVSFEAYSRTPPRALRDVFPEAFGDCWEEAHGIYQNHMNQIHLHHMTPMKGAIDLVAVLREMPFFRAIVSNKEGPFLRAEAAHLGWTDCFHKIVGSGDAAFDKPNPSPVHLAASCPDEIAFSPTHDDWFIGDSAVDVACAVNAGCRPVVVGELHPAPGVPPQTEVTYFSHCGELAQFLQTAVQTARLAQQASL